MDTSEYKNMEVPEKRTSCDTRTLLEKGAYTEWQVFFLLRMEALLRLEEELVQSPEAVTDEGAVTLKMIRKAIYSSYRDCIDLGVGDAAKRLFSMMAGRA